MTTETTTVTPVNEFNRSLLKRLEDVKKTLAESDSENYAKLDTQWTVKHVPQVDMYLFYYWNKLKFELSGSGKLLLHAEPESIWWINKSSVLNSVLGVEEPCGYNEQKITLDVLGQGVYRIENFKATATEFGIHGNILKPITAKWEHSIVNLKYVNAWIKENIPGIADIRKAAKLLGTSNKEDILIRSSDILDYVLAKEANNTQRMDDLLELFAYGKGLKSAAAAYLDKLGDTDAYIKTYFGTLKELHTHRSSR